MDPILKKVLVGASKLLPDFNDELLTEYRRYTVNKIPEQLDQMLRTMDILTMYEGTLQYIGYRRLSPEERIELIRTNKIRPKQVSIHPASFEQIEYLFRYEGQDLAMCISVPYLEHGCILYNGNKYFINLPEVTKGGLTCTATGLLLRIPKVPIKITRSVDYSMAFTTVEGRGYREVVPMIKIHQGKRGRGKRTGVVPILLYHLVRMPFDATMAYYGFQPGEIALVETLTPDAEYCHIEIKPSIYLRVKHSAMKDLYKLRAVASFLKCLSDSWNTVPFTYRELVASDCNYYQVVLGWYTYPTVDDRCLLYENAGKHLETTNTLVDAVVKHQLSTIGIYVEDIYELLKVIYDTIDAWIVRFNTVDLFDQQIGLSSLLLPLITNINDRQYTLINCKKEGLDLKRVAAFVTGSSKDASWISNLDKMLNSNPSLFNDNTVLSVLTDRYRSADGPSNSKRKTKGKRIVSTEKLKAHPSQISVESILQMSNSPIITGKINPMALIDIETGFFRRPDWYGEIEHVFD